jgi:hypothetical protein
MPNVNGAINIFAPYWIDWLDSDTLELFKQYGYYSTPLRLKDGRVFEKTKIIGLNTQACNIENWHLLKNRYDPGQELEWLEKELLQLE